MSTCAVFILKLRQCLGLPVDDQRRKLLANSKEGYASTASGGNERDRGWSDGSAGSPGVNSLSIPGESQAECYYELMSPESLVQSGVDASSHQTIESLVERRLRHLALHHSIPKLGILPIHNASEHARQLWYIPRSGGRTAGSRKPPSLDTPRKRTGVLMSFARSANGPWIFRLWGADAQDPRMSTTLTFRNRHKQIYGRLEVGKLTNKQEASLVITGQETIRIRVKNHTLVYNRASKPQPICTAKFDDQRISWTLAPNEVVNQDILLASGWALALAWLQGQMPQPDGTTSVSSSTGTMTTTSSTAGSLQHASGDGKDGKDENTS